RVVFAERIAVPVVRHQDAAEVRMGVEGDAEQVVHLALGPVRVGKEGRDRGDRLVLADTHPQEDPPGPAKRAKGVKEVQRVLPGRIIDPEKVREHLVIELGIVPEQSDSRAQRLLRDGDPVHAAIRFRLRRQSRHRSLQALQLEGEFFHGEVFMRSYSYSYSY